MKEAYILLVDDEVNFVETLASRLARRDFKVITAYDGEACLEKLKLNDGLDVVILDIKMSGMDGIETLRNIKKLAPLIEVLMLTGQATVETAIKGMKLGAFDFLLKPCEIEELVSKIENATMKKRDHEERIQDARNVRIKEILEIYDA
jgi:DNA-binding NtrC family response regulator